MFLYASLGTTNIVRAPDWEDEWFARNATQFRAQRIRCPCARS
jgi:hypothetical protein